jgi:hypothetical protein
MCPSDLMVGNVGGHLLRDKSVEQHPKNISLEVPAVNASPKIVSYLPDGFV